MDKKKTALVIGTGAGGGVAARALQGKYQVTMLEEGKEFRPFSYPVGRLAELRRTGLFFDERLIRLLLPNMRLERSQEVVIARGIGVGGTTPILIYTYHRIQPLKMYNSVVFNTLTSVQPPLLIPAHSHYSKRTPVP